MYVRVVKVKQKTGMAEFVQLAHNVRDPITGVAKAKILHHFGRADQLDLDALRRLVKSICRFLEPQEASAILDRITPPTPSPFEFLGSRQLGGTWLLDGLWKRLHIDQVLQKNLRQRGYKTPIERLLFAMVADRALAPSSKLAMEHWVSQEVTIPGLPTVDVHQLYRAMDFLLESAEDLQKEVFFTVANLLNLEVDLIFLDTTSTYFEVESEDVDEPEGVGLRKRGYSKDNHAELPQAIIGFAVTRTGIPVRCWVWPGSTSDQAVVEEVKRDLQGWQLGRVVSVADTGFNSEKNRHILQQAAGHYIMGEKLRQGSQGAPVEVLSHPGKFKTLENGLQIKEVFLNGGSTARRRFVIIRNPAEAERDRAKRQDILAEVERRLAALKQLTGQPHQKAACALRAHPVFGRYVTQTPTGRLTLDRKKIDSDAHLDGKYLVSTSDERMPAEDVAMGYKQLWAVERIFRDLKHVVDIRPVYHRLADRIKAHVLLCWLALLLIRVAENETKLTWRQLRQVMTPLQVGIHGIDAGEVWQTCPVTPEQKTVFTALGLTLPPRYYSVTTPTRDA